MKRQRRSSSKEATHFTNAISELDEKLTAAETDEDRELILAEKEKIAEQLARVSDDIASNEMREKNTRAGHVYIISNIGSFGSDIYKIGMTKRLDPQDRIDELGDASVPYRFDVHAMIFSDDAPTLENALHNAFAHRRLNLVNQRREFFNVSLSEIERVVRKNFGKPVEFTMAAQAAEYRQSEKMRSRMNVETKAS